MSIKMIKIIKSIYDCASFMVRSRNEFSNLIEVMEGVLQGESLLFTLFIADFEKKLREARNEGININGCVSLLLSLHADDAVAVINS